MDACVGKTAEQDTKVAVFPRQRRTLQSARERIPVALLSETAPRYEEFFLRDSSPSGQGGTREGDQLAGR